MHVSLNAKGCAPIAEWEQIRTWGDRHGARLTRLDLAHDDFDGETISVDKAIEWYQNSRFALNGRPAGARHIDDLGSGQGRTLYVGKRQNGKLCRVYEKGKELGDPSSLWCRVEVELHNKNRVIPWDAVVRPGVYLAGAYPCLVFLSLEQSKIKTVQRIFEMTYAEMCEWVRTSAGRALNVMREVEDGGAEAVLDRVSRDGRPKRLRGVSTDHLDG